VTPFLIFLAIVALAVGYTFHAKALIEARWPKIGRLVLARGVPAHVIERGQGGPEILLVHGAASNARELLAAMDGRLDDLRLIAPDRPGLGYSCVPTNSHELGVQAAFIADIVRQTAKGPVVAVGHSWGSGVILRLALDHPDLVRALVLVAPASHPWNPKLNLINKLACIPILGDLLVWSLPALLGPRLMAAGIGRGFAPGPVMPEDYANIIGTPLFFRPTSFKANAADMEAGSHQMGLQALRYQSLTLPVTIISGQGDVIVYNAIHAAGLARDIPHADSYRVDGAGHMPHWVDPDLVAGVIKSYAHGTAPAATSAQFRAGQ
jgi:pimeloyl-ACP methyl ester carboxylesterase